MSKLDSIIAQKAYELDLLRNLRQIYESGDCNNCQNKECGVMPKAGQLVRYNCPYYQKEDDA